MGGLGNGSRRVLGTAPGSVSAEDFEGTFHHWQFYDWAGRLGWNERGWAQNPVYANYIADPLGRPARMSTWVGDPSGTGTPVFRVHAGVHEIEERDVTGLSVLATFVHGARVDEVLQSSRGSNFYWHHTDDLGNALCVTDVNGDVAERYDYQDFGWPEIYSDAGSWRAASASWIQNPFLFNGRRWDPVAQQYEARPHRVGCGRVVQEERAIGPARTSSFKMLGSADNEGKEPGGIARSAR